MTKKQLLKKLEEKITSEICGKLARQYARYCYQTETEYDINIDVLISSGGDLLDELIKEPFQKLINKKELEKFIKEWDKEEKNETSN